MLDARASVVPGSRIRRQPAAFVRVIHIVPSYAPVCMTPILSRTQRMDAPPWNPTPPVNDFYRM